MAEASVGKTPFWRMAFPGDGEEKSPGSGSTGCRGNTERAASRSVNASYKNHRREKVKSRRAEALRYGENVEFFAEVFEYYVGDQAGSEI